MNIKEKLRNYFTAPGFKWKFIVMALGVFFMGFFLSFLIEVNLGTDPCTFMNVTVSERLGILFGTWQLILNAVLFIFVILFARKHIGPGTIANMVFIGYISDFFRWLWHRTIPEYVFKEFPARGVVFAIALICFIISASFYMNAEMGVAPYDAIPMIISEKLLPKVPFKFIRICFDGFAVLVGIILGGRVEIAHILMVFLLGPTIGIVGGFLRERVFNK